MHVTGTHWVHACCVAGSAVQTEAFANVFWAHGHLQTHVRHRLQGSDLDVTRSVAQKNSRELVLRQVKYEAWST